MIRAVQLKHFEKEILSLVKLGVNCPNANLELKRKDSHLIQLSPFLDEDFNLRSAGRLGKSEIIPYETKHP